MHLNCYDSTDMSVLIKYSCCRGSHFSSSKSKTASTYTRQGT